MAGDKLPFQETKGRIPIEFTEIASIQSFATFPVPSRRPVVTGQVSVLVLKHEQPLREDFVRSTFQRLVQPDFAISWIIHTCLLLVLALLFVPTAAEKLIMVTARQTVDLEFDPISIESMEINVLPAEIELPQPDEPDLSSNLDSLPERLLDAPSFEDADIKFGQTLAASGVDTRTEVTENQPTDEIPDEAKEIQSRVAKAGGQSGEVQFSLVWETRSDVDLHVITPKGQRIFYDFRNSRFGGVLDVDRNAKNNKLTDAPVENIRWKEGLARTGRYTVMVHLFNNRGDNSIPFELMSKLGGDIRMESSSVSFGNNLVVYRYFFFADDVPKNQRPDKLQELKSLQEQEEAEAKRLFGKITSPRNQEADLWRIINNYPHTETAIDALQLIRGSGSK